MLVTIGIDYHPMTLIDIFPVISFTAFMLSKKVLQTESVPTGAVLGNLEIDFRLLRENFLGYLAG